MTTVGGRLVIKDGGVVKSKTLGLVTEERGHRSTRAKVGREKDGGRA